MQVSEMGDSVWASNTLLVGTKTVELVLLKHQVNAPPFIEFNYNNEHTTLPSLQHHKPALTHSRRLHLKTLIMFLSCCKEWARREHFSPVSSKKTKPKLSS